LRNASSSPARAPSAWSLRRGSYARLEPALRRTVRNYSKAVARVLIISAPVTSGYEPMEWA